MANTKYCKDGKVTITLTKDEYNILWECLSRCQDCMRWNELEGVANDGEGFLWEIDDYNDYRILKDLEI